MTQVGAATWMLLPWVLGSIPQDEGRVLQPIQDLPWGSGARCGGLLLAGLGCAAETFMQ